MLSLKVPVYLANIIQVRSAFRSYCPSLDNFEDFTLDVVVDSGWSVCFEKGGQVVHKLAGGDLYDKVLATILEARICELFPACQRAKLWNGKVCSSYIQCC